MATYKYLIVGGGMTAAAAAKGIRELDPDGTIAIIAGESHPPYERPPLSKGVWRGDPVDNIWIDIGKLGVELHLARRAQKLDVQGKRVTDAQGEQYGFDRLLLATGCTPRRLPTADPDGGHGESSDERVIYYRTFADYERLRRLTERGAHFAVVGGGFIGSELAAALRMSGKQVTMVLRDERIGASVYPPDLGEYLNGYYREKGVEVLTKVNLTAMNEGDEQVTLHIEGVDGLNPREVTVDGVVAGIGVEPNVDLAKQAGLEVSDGILVDEFLRAGHADIYAAGDVVNFYDSLLATRRRVEHEDNANKTGRAAGRNMAGAEEPYTYSPFFYSDLFDLGYEAVGEINAKLETVSDWKEPYREGVVYYLHEGRVRGVLLWNVWKRIKAARQLISEPGPFRPQDLLDRGLSTSTVPGISTPAGSQ